MSPKLSNTHSRWMWRWATGGALLAAACVVAAPAVAAPPTGGDRVVLTSDTGSVLTDLGTRASLSRDAGLVAFTSSASGLPDANGIPQGYVKDLSSESVTSLSVGYDGQPANAPVEYPTLSADGRFAVFVSAATNLVRGFDTHGVSQAYRRTLATGDIVPVSGVGARPAEGAVSGVAGAPSISADGDRIVFSTTLPLRGPAPAHRQVYLRFVSWGETLLLSQRAGTAGVSPSQSPSISENGRYVAWISSDLTLIGGHGAGYMQAMALDLDDYTAGPFVLSTAPDGALGNASTISVDISDIGSAVMSSMATNLAGTRLTGRTQRAFFHPADSAGSRLVTHALNEFDVDGGSVAGSPQISADGGFVAYASSSDKLTAEGGNGSVQVLKYTTSAATSEVLTTTKGELASGDSYSPDITADGTYVVYVSESEDLIPGDGTKPPRSVIVQNAP